MKRSRFLIPALCAVFSANQCIATQPSALRDSYGVIVVGGTSRAVGAAVAARSEGADVLLVASGPSLGEDTAGKCLPDSSGNPVAPFLRRRELDRRIMESGVAWRTHTYAIDVDRDRKGEVCGVWLANRSGVRRVFAKCVVDATERAGIAKCAGSEFRDFPAGKHRFMRYVVSGQKPTANGMLVEVLGATGRHKVEGRKSSMATNEVEGVLYRCSMSLPMRDGSAGSFAKAEQAARDMTWTSWQLEAAETCVFDAPDGLMHDVAYMFTAGPLGILSPAEAGRAAARCAAARGAVAAGDAPFAEREIGEYDVVVVGMGTGGAPAAIAASRGGMKTAVFEYAHRAGGQTTEGCIGSYWYGNRVGFTKEIDEGMARTGLVAREAKAEWLRREAHRAGAEIFFGAFAYGVVRNGDRITGVKVALADGEHGIFRARMFVDATGNCDLAAAAGERTEFIAPGELSLQGATFTRSVLARSDVNSDFTFICDTDPDDLWYAALRGRNCYQEIGTWDQSAIAGTRERRRLVGRFRVSPQDVILGRRYPDIVCITRSNFDTHGQTVDPQFFISPPPHEPMEVCLPFRSMIPMNADNLIVVGLGISADRDAMPILRMQPDVQNQGFVAGCACAMSVKSGVGLMGIDIRALQRKLVAKGVIPEWALTATDTMPLSDVAISNAVASLPEGGDRNLAAVFAAKERSRPLLERALASATEGKAYLAYAQTLAFIGSAAGSEVLADALDSVDGWDEGWNYRGMGQFGRSVSELDAIAIALGTTRSERAFGPLARLAAMLRPSSEYSHFRAVALAFERLGDRRAAPLLANLLSMPGVAGHAFSYERQGNAPAIPMYDVYNYSGPGAKKGRKGPSVPDYERTYALRELCLARALLHLGDKDGIALRILKAYSEDPRRAYAAHAKMVLARPSAPVADGDT